jgi:hypothetical protein
MKEHSDFVVSLANDSLQIASCTHAPSFAKINVGHAVLLWVRSFSCVVIPRTTRNATRFILLLRWKYSHYCASRQLITHLSRVAIRRRQAAPIPRLQYHDALPHVARQWNADTLARKCMYRFHVSHSPPLVFSNFYFFRCGSCDGKHQCVERCERLLFCGHVCARLCHLPKECSPCEKKCSAKCCHSRCPEKCSTPVSTVVDACRLLSQNKYSFLHLAFSAIPA